MCGIAGLIGVHGVDRQKLDSMVSSMSAVLVNRGPDDHGVWSDETSGVALGHRRLSIIDLSEHGHQPMHSACGRFVTVFNGEIYNFRELGKILAKAGYVFRGHSDTEVLLAAITEWGIEKAVQRFNGMFAIAVWDKKERVLHLVRDRMGEKPLYYGWVGDVFLFGSELKALHAYENFKPTVNRDALALYFRYRYVPYPYSIYEGIYKLTPGSILTVHPGKPGQLPEPVPYWSLQELVETGVAEPFSNSESDIVSNFEQLLGDAVEIRMVSDVPLGAFLSGGIDSSTIVALMQSRSSRPIETYSIGFNEADYDEAIYAKAVATHLGTSHTELYVTAKEAMDVIPSLAQMYDEPFADSSQIPTHLLAQLARKHVTVALSGDAGDELFAGYWRHFMAMRIWNNAQNFPEFMRRLCAGSITSISPASWDRMRRGVDFLLPEKLRNFAVGDRAYKMASIIGSKNETEMYRALVSDWFEPEKLVLNSKEPLLDSMDESGSLQLADYRNEMMFLDSMNYLPGDILTKVDRATMAVSLEARVPFLDPKVIEFSSRVPMDMKVRNGKGKWILRQLLSRYVPDSLVNRPKMGFGVPIDSWLRGPLRGWAEDLLDEQKLKEQGYLNSTLVQQTWQEHISGKRNWQNQLWDVLMFQAWQSHWGN
jgi:asparagine synthase (glutamine-hydrolysing)